MREEPREPWYIPAATIAIGAIWAFALFQNGRLSFLVLPVLLVMAILTWKTRLKSLYSDQKEKAEEAHTIPQPAPSDND